MNYEPNTTHWEPGSLVIHDADAKRPDMLMRVVGYGPDGLCVTEYVERRWQDGHGKRMRSPWRNPITVLHTPERFGLFTLAQQDAKENGG